MAKGVPTARSKSYKANIKLQEKTTSLPIKEKVHSPPSNSGNDVLPSPMTIPATDGAPRAFEMARVLTQTLMHMNPANHISDILKLLDLSISDCSAWYNEVYDHNIALQQQLDDLNSKMLTQDSDVLNLQDQLKKSQVAQEFYRHQALKADMVPPRRRCRFVSSDADNALTPDQLYQQLLWARDDIQVRDRALERLQVQHTQLQASFEQVLTSSSELLALHVTLLEQHLDLHARQQSCASALSTKLLNADTLSQHATSQLLEMRAKYEKLDAQVTAEDPILLAFIASDINHGRHYRLTSQLLASRPRLRRLLPGH